MQVQVEQQLLVDYVEPDQADAGPRLKHGTVAVRGHGGGAVLISAGKLSENTATHATWCASRFLRVGRFMNCPNQGVVYDFTCIARIRAMASR